MTKTSTNINEICNRYAKALILSSSNENELKEVKDNFVTFNSLIDANKEFYSYINNPLINSQKKSKALKNLCIKLSYNKVFIGLITTLTKHGKILLYRRIFEHFQKTIDKNNGITEIQITTSEPLDKKVENNIENKLSSLLNLKIKLIKTVDKEIIGGVIIKIRSIMIDNSIKSKLMEFKI